jgi:hypothetical protein
LQTTKPGWHNDTVWNSIALEGIGQAFKLLPLPKRKNVSKILNGWLTLENKDKNFRRNRNLNAPDAKPGMRTRTTFSNMRTAEQPRQDIMHYFFSTSVTAKSGSSRSWSALHDWMSQWLNSGYNPATINQEKYKTTPQLSFKTR